MLPVDAEVVPDDDLADEAEDARDACRDAEDRRRCDSRRRWPSASGSAEVPARASPVSRADHARTGIGSGARRRIALCYHRSRPLTRVFFRMPNIRQQKKRVRTAARERAENLRYRSTVRTLTRRLSDAVADGDQEQIEAAHRELVRWLDQAAAQGATPPEHRRPPEGAGSGSSRAPRAS